MEFSYSNPRSGSTSTQTDATSDRLKKAIERNRAKQARRENRMSQTSGASNPAPGWTAPGATSSSTSRMASSATSRRGTRRTVARPTEETEFTTAIRKSPRKAPSTVSYTTKSRSLVRSTKKAPARRAKSKKQTVAFEWLVKGGWVLCGFLILRLIFSGGGVIDYYTNKSLMEGREEELHTLIQENKELLHEIERIKKDPRYQRKLVREHLGFIARDEFLILFPKDQS